MNEVASVGPWSKGETDSTPARPSRLATVPAGASSRDSTGPSSDDRAFAPLAACWTCNDVPSQQTIWNFPWRAYPSSALSSDQPRACKLSDNTSVGSR